MEPQLSSFGMKGLRMDIGTFEGGEEAIELSWRGDPKATLSDFSIDVSSSTSSDDDDVAEDPPVVYHVHKCQLAVGPRACEYFARLFAPRGFAGGGGGGGGPHFTEKASSRAHLSFPAPVAEAFPAFLDFIYGGVCEAALRAPPCSAAAMLYLASYLRCRALHAAAARIAEHDLRDACPAHAPRHLAAAEALGVEALAAAALDACAVAFEDDAVFAELCAELDPPLLARVLRRRASLAKHGVAATSAASASAPFLMERVARYCRSRPRVAGFMVNPTARWAAELGDLLSALADRIAEQPAEPEQPTAEPAELMHTAPTRQPGTGPAAAEGGAAAASAATAASAAAAAGAGSDSRYLLELAVAVGEDALVMRFAAATAAAWETALLPPPAPAGKGDDAAAAAAAGNGAEDEVAVAAGSGKGALSSLAAPTCVKLEVASQALEKARQSLTQLRAELADSQRHAPDGLGLMLAACKDSEAAVRAAAAQAVGALAVACCRGERGGAGGGAEGGAVGQKHSRGTVEVRVVPVLQAMADDDDPAVGVAARDALAKTTEALTHASEAEGWVVF